jgi:hypothetical protein
MLEFNGTCSVYIYNPNKAVIVTGIDEDQLIFELNEYEESRETTEALII